MAIATISAFLEQLRRFHLLEPDQLAQQLPPGFAEPRDLAREFVRRGWLTPFQINKLFQDRGTELLLGSYVLRMALA